MVLIQITMLTAQLEIRPLLNKLCVDFNIYRIVLQWYKVKFSIFFIWSELPCWLSKSQLLAIWDNEHPWWRSVLSECSSSSHMISLSKLIINNSIIDSSFSRPQNVLSCQCKPLILSKQLDLPQSVIPMPWFCHLFCMTSTTLCGLYK